MSFSMKKELTKQLINKINIISKKSVFSPIEIQQIVTEDFINTINKTKYHSVLSTTALDYRKKEHMAGLLS